MLKKKFYLIPMIVFFTIPIFADSIKIICSTDNPKDSLHVFALESFGELLKEYSGGELEAVVHYKGNKEFPAIRGEEVNMNMIVTGTGGLDVTAVAVGNAARKAEVLNFLSLPYIVSDMESAKKLFDSNFMKEDINVILKEKYGIRAIGWLIGGFRNLTNSEKEVTRIEDIKGLDIRLAKNRLMVDTYTKFGANVVPISWGETFDALKNGKVDGQENPYSVIVASKFWNANQKYVTNNGPFLWVGPILVNNTWYESLSKKHQDILSRAAMDASKAEWKWIEEENANFRSIIESNGMRILDLKDKDKWIEVTRSLWNDYYQTIGSGDKTEGKKIVDNALEVMSK